MSLRLFEELNDEEKIKEEFGQESEIFKNKDLVISLARGLKGSGIKYSSKMNLHLYHKDANDTSPTYRICHIRIDKGKIIVGKKGRNIHYGDENDKLLTELLNILKKYKNSETTEEINCFDESNIIVLANALRELVDKTPIKENSNEGEKTMESKKIEKIKEEIKEILKYNKQVVLTGAPGTGKTYMAKQICKEILKEKLNKENLSGEEIKKYIYFVQFHPSYDYTDFVEGLRPVKKGNDIGFERRDGIFMELCKQAKEDEDINNNYYLIIDEINRADLSKVFGELMYCLEYRGEEGKLKTQYNNLMEDTHPFKEGFYVPENVYIIATMNDIDRSVEAFDFALRRRFFWYEIKANDVMEEVIESMLQKSDVNNDIVEELIGSAITLNEAISEKGKDYGLNEHYHLGPAYFGKIDDSMLNNGGNNTIENIKEKIWTYRVELILREYVRGYDDVDKFIKDLKDTFFDKNNKNADDAENQANNAGENKQTDNQGE